MNPLLPLTIVATLLGLVAAALARVAWLEGRAQAQARAAREAAIVEALRAAWAESEAAERARAVEAAHFVLWTCEVEAR